MATIRDLCDLAAAELEHGGVVATLEVVLDTEVVLSCEGWAGPPALLLAPELDTVTGDAEGRGSLWIYPPNRATQEAS